MTNSLLSDYGHLVNGNPTKVARVSMPCTLHQDAVCASFHLADGHATALYAAAMHAEVRARRHQQKHN